MNTSNGFSKITRYCKEENAKLPEIDLSLGGVTARCFASDTYLSLMNEHKMNENDTKIDIVSPKMSPCDEIYKLICNNKDITTQQIADTLGISKRTVLRKLSEMTDKVVHKGTPNGGYWEIVQGDEE